MLSSFKSAEVQASHQNNNTTQPGNHTEPFPMLWLRIGLNIGPKSCRAVSPSYREHAPEVSDTLCMTSAGIDISSLRAVSPMPEYSPLLFKAPYMHPQLSCRQGISTCWHPRIDRNWRAILLAETHLSFHNPSSVQLLGTGPRTWGW